LSQQPQHLLFLLAAFLVEPLEQLTQHVLLLNNIIQDQKAMLKLELQTPQAAAADLRQRVPCRNVSQMRFTRQNVVAVKCTPCLHVLYLTIVLLHFQTLKGLVLKKGKEAMTRT
jgi:hypothetical protein